MPEKRPDRWMPFYPADYLRDTGRLTTEMHGAYLLLILDYWVKGEALPDDNRQLAAIARLTPARWREARKIIEPYFQIADGKWKHKRIEAELANARALSSSRRTTGGLGGSAKWGHSPQAARDHAATRSQRLSAARQRGTHTQEEWLALIEITGRRCVRCGDEGCKLVKDHIAPIYKGGSDAIDNLQPLCQTCNGAKGPETTDHRPSNWQERLAKCLATVGIGKASNAKQNAKQTPSKTPTPSPIRSINLKPASIGSVAAGALAGDILAFQGRAIRLDAAGLAECRKQYPHPNLEAVLRVYDAKWFDRGELGPLHRVLAFLAREHPPNGNGAADNGADDSEALRRSLRVQAYREHGRWEPGWGEKPTAAELSGTATTGAASAA